MRNWQAHVTAAALGLVLAAPVAAVTVGDMRALSAVGEPLQLDIGLADAFDVRDGDITVGVASAADHARFGVTRPAWADQLAFAVVRDGGGQLSVRVTGPVPVQSSAVSFLVRVGWPGHVRMQQVTTALRDPAEAVTDAVPAPVAPAVIPVRPAPVVADADRVVIPATPAATPRPAAPAPIPAAASATVASGPQVVRVRRGDTLSSLASQWDVDLSLAQRLQIIRAANEHAFIGGNINRLRAGARLTLPDTGTASVPSRREASAWLRQALQEADGERAAHRPAEAAPAPAGRPAPGAGAALTLVGPRAGQDAASARATGDAGVAGDKDEAADAAATAATEQALADAEQERARLLGDRKRLQARVAELTAQAEQDDQRLQVLDDRLAAFEAGAGEARAAEGAADARAAEVQAGEIQAGPTDEDARRAAAERTLQWMLAGLLILLLLIALWLRQRSVEAGQADEDKPEGPVAFDQPPETPQTLAAVDALAAGQQEAVVAHEPESAQDAPAVAQSAFAPDAATLPVDTTPADDGFAPLPEVPESAYLAADEPVRADEDEYDFLSDSEAEAFQTRLDLAQAYIDMGESASARDLLELVSQGGTGEQRRRAEALLRTLHGA